ncbi:MAG: phenylacetate-CoA oxygenase subunit PaaJ [Saprospiraceae bacterium]|jgi:ring-1,2-phenylacetyl-CoA epoxidase subunit PaaD|nr:phenylacetate-CoA oxygenase subunit PaaJ [Saprospiraceae bacterium]MBP9210767.1 phenylacetate-CoA oxygenase subunit PaaJ [Saprospiraceae bacterium]MBV6473884.1 putative 1,2-phenylacetyl-CoA epoxidase, subunit D [Saprospiraceae bacterium]
MEDYYSTEREFKKHHVTEVNKSVLEVLDTVMDPEIPVLSILDLGIVREVRVQDGKVDIAITPTYTGCPAMHLIEMEIRAAMAQSGLEANVKTVLSPAWTTDWMREGALEKLSQYGIAPPGRIASMQHADTATPKRIECPQCTSSNTEVISEFGSTACKALYRCLDCREPFDYFKCH